MNGNNREEPGSFPAIRSDKDGLIVDMKLRGHRNREIAEATGMALKTAQNIVSKGGRLYPALEALRFEKSLVLREGHRSAWDNLCAAKEPSVEELRRIAREDPNPAARLKAIDMILDLTGVRDGEKPPLLDPNDLDGSVRKFLQWANELLVRTYREQSPELTLAKLERQWTEDERVALMNDLRQLFARQTALREGEHSE